MAFVEITNLTKEYRRPQGILRLLSRSALKENVLAINNLSFQIRDGEIFGLIGPNGAGKTTLVKMLATLLRPTSGCASINGLDVVRDEDKVKKIIGFVAGDDRSFYWRLTGRQNLAFFSALYGIPKEIARQRIGTVLAQLDLASSADNLFYTYSSGMKQKLSIARGLIVDPIILFLDEPTKSVDPVTSVSLKRFISDLSRKKGKTILITSHRLEEVESLCDRLAIINKGEIGFIGSVNELRSHMDYKDSYSLMIKGISSEQLRAIEQKLKLTDSSIEAKGDGCYNFKFLISSSSEIFPLIIEEVIKAKGRIVDFSSHKGRLEEMFVELVGGEE